MGFFKIINLFNKPSSLRSQIIVGFTFLTIVAITVVGFTALQLNYRYLENEKRLQSQSMIQEFYSSLESQLSNLVIITTSHLALDAKEHLSNIESLHQHLLDIHKGLPKVDLLIYCNEAGQVVTFTGEINPISNCNLEPNPQYIVHNHEGIQQVWFLRGRKITDQNSNSVILGVELDDHLLEEMCDHCDLYHSLVLNDTVIATSFGNKFTEKSNIQAIPSRNAGDQFNISYIMGGNQFYVSYFPLNNMGLEVEVALDVTSYHQDHRQQEFILTIVIISVVIISILFGAFFAQLLHRPLAQLVSATSQFGDLDLSKPIDVKTNLVEVIELTQVLEDSRKRSNDALTSLQKEKQWSDLLLESIVEGIIILEKGKIEYFSRGAERITGLKEAEVLGKSINDVLIASDQSNPFLSILPSPGGKLRISFNMQDQTKRILSITHAQLSTRNSDLPKTVLVLRDVNEEEALSHLLGSFIGNITHEFRTPLSALSASVEILMEEADNLKPVETHELLNSIKLSTINLENLIDNLLEGSSIETGRFRVNPHPSDLISVINGACTTIEPLFLKYGQKLIIDLSENLPLVMIDARRVNQVLLNLMANASKYGPSDNLIEIKARLVDHFVEVSVSDRGKGIPEPYKEKIFSGFMLNTIDKSRMQKGSGLGLSVSQAIIKAHGGQVGVRDRKNGGSEFWFTLPITGEA
ncbi:MAG TPA: ATP-binding protein [Anaerolineaceae bacterium]|nr:ATP-binding protein [Anaerolineaceae bacterium]